MAQIHNSELMKELQTGAKIQISRDKVPNELAEKVVPVMEVSPKLLRRADVVVTTNKTTTGTQTIATLQAGKQFYITAAGIDIIKDAACDMGNGRVNIGLTINGASVGLFGISVLTLTAQNSSQYATFPTPIKVDIGSTIQITGSVSTFTVGSCIRTGWITGYYEENPNA
jgi:hypothetical protein